MSNKWQGFVNEKMYFVAGMKTLLRDSIEREHVGEQKMFLESAIMMLTKAWYGYLNELAVYYRVRGFQGQTVTALCEAVPDGSGELDCLQDLSVDRTEWLNRLLFLEAMTHRAEAVNLKASERTLDSEEQSIMIASDALVEKAASIDDIEWIYRSMKQQVEESRRHHAEW